MTELTPELIKKVADLFEEEGYADADDLRGHANTLEEERAKEKRLAIAIGDQAVNAFTARFGTSQLYDQTDAIFIGEQILETIKIEYNNDKKAKTKVETTWQTIQQVPQSTVVADSHGTEWVKNDRKILYKHKSTGVWYAHPRVIHENLQRAPFTYVRAYGEA